MVLLEEEKKSQGWTHGVDETGSRSLGGGHFPHNKPKVIPPHPPSGPTTTTLKSKIRAEKELVVSNPEATLQVPFTVGSRLRDQIQHAEDTYSRLVGCNKIKVVEGGGDKMIHLLGKTDPWSARMTCDDPQCKT